MADKGGPPWVELLSAVLRRAPRLPKALCRRQPNLFDADDPDPIERENQQREAMRLCNACPQLEECRAWVDSLPKSSRPHGVVAGRVWPPPPKPAGRPKKAAL